MPKQVPDRQQGAGHRVLVKYALREPPQSEVVCRIYAVKILVYAVRQAGSPRIGVRSCFFPVTAAFGAEVVSETGAFDSLSGW
jgi:hypothetical protein